MGVIINDVLTTRSGIELQGCYVSFRGACHIMKCQYNKHNQINNDYEPVVRYKVVATAQIFKDKQAFMADREPIVRDIGIESQELTDEQLEERGGVMKNYIYPKLKEVLGFQNYTDD